jgi:ABC-type branched-subunit amino acid transport system substrate-binding protein
MVSACSQLPPSLGGTKPPAQAPVQTPPPAAKIEAPPQVQAPPPAPAAAPVTPPLPNRSGTAAILLPLSGPQAPLGAALLNAAQMALFEVADDSFTLVPLDTKGTPEGAATAAQAAVAQHAEIILGPLFSAEAKAVGSALGPLHMPVVSFTSDRAAVGNGVYSLGFLPGPQAVQVAAFARGQGKTRLAVLAPSNEDGRRIAEFLQNDAQTQPTITVSQYYDPAASDIAATVKRMIRLDPRTGDVGFDALLLLESGQRLRNFAAMLSVQGVDPAKVKLLGTMLWTDANPGAEAALNGAWFAAPPAAGHGDFEARYIRAFGTRPPRIASLGYDAAALAAVLARKSPHDFSDAALLNPVGFAGVDGIFRLKPDGTAERGYAIDEVQQGGTPKEIQAAPVAFQ